MFVNCSDNPTSTQLLEYDVALAFVINADSLRQKALLTFVNSVEEEYSNSGKLINSASFYLNNIKLIHNSFPDYTKPHSCEYYYNYYSDNLNFKLLLLTKIITIITKMKIIGQV